MNQYEVAVLYHPDLEIDLEKATSKVEKIIADNKGKIVKADDWGKRKLAYPIKKQEHAVYVFYTVDLPSESVQKVERTFNITDEIIRFLITKPDLKAIAKAEVLKAEKAAKAAANPDVSDEDEEGGRESGPRSRREVGTPVEVSAQHRRGKAAERGDQDDDEASEEESKEENKVQ